MKLSRTNLSIPLIFGILTQIPFASLAQDQVRTIEIHARRFAFSPAEVSLKKGETVKLRLISEDVPHSILISDLKINETITKGHPAEITVTPDRLGDFRGKCGRFCGSGHGSMLFTVHVKD